MHRTTKEELHLKMLIYAFTSEKERDRDGASWSSFIFQIQNVQLFKETQQKKQLYCVVVAAHKGAHSLRFGSSKPTKKKTSLFNALDWTRMQPRRFKWAQQRRLRRRDISVITQHLSLA